VGQVQLPWGSGYVADDDFVEPWRDHEAVLLQHGFLRTGALWAPWVPHLSRDYRVLRPDLRGCGRSEDPGNRGEYSVDSFTSDLIGILDALELDSVHYVGESLGAVLGVALSVAAPDRVRSLSLVHAPTRLRSAAHAQQAVGYSGWEQAVKDIGLAAWWLKARAAGGDLYGDERADNYLAGMAGKVPLPVAFGLRDIAASFDLAAILPKVRVPTRFLISSRYSYTTSADQQEKAAALVPGATLHIYNSRFRSFFGYFDADMVAPDVLKFIKQVDGIRSK
jgi:pimeloyl-ACP methyl ester carboxylesterase